MKRGDMKKIEKITEKSYIKYLEDNTGYVIGMPIYDSNYFRTICVWNKLNEVIEAVNLLIENQK